MLFVLRKEELQGALLIFEHDGDGDVEAGPTPDTLCMPEGITEVKVKTLLDGRVLVEGEDFDVLTEAEYEVEVALEAPTGNPWEGPELSFGDSGGWRG